MDCDKRLLYGSLTASQFALFDLVPRFLRALVVKCKDLRVDLFFYCHGELLEEEKEMILIDICGEFSDRIDGHIITFFGHDALYGVDAQFRWKSHVIH